MQFADVAYALKTQTAIKMPLKSGKVLTQTQAAAPYRYLSAGQGRFFS